MTNREITFRALHLVKRATIALDGSSDNPEEAAKLQALTAAHGIVAAQMAMRARQDHPTDQCTPEEMAEIIARTMHEKSINPAKFL